MFMKIDDYVHIRLHHEYDISFTVTLNKKLNQQYVSFFKILKKMKRLIYRLNLFFHWRIHSILSVIQLKSAISSSKDFFRRSRSKQSDSVHVDENIEQIKSWKIKRFLNKRQTKRKNSKYFVRWRKYESEHDDWRNLSKLKNVVELIKKYEKIIQIIVVLFERLKFFVVINIRKFVVAADRKSLTNVVVLFANRKSFAISLVESFAKTSTFIVVNRKLLAASQKSFVVVRKSLTASSVKSVVAQKLLIASQKSFVVARKSLTASFVKSIVAQKLLTASFVKSTFIDSVVNQNASSSKKSASLNKSFNETSVIFRNLVSSDRLFAVVISAKTLLVAENSFFIALIRR